MFCIPIVATAALAYAVGLGTMKKVGEKPLIAVATKKGVTFCIKKTHTHANR